LSRPQPPEAVAEGESLQGIASRQSSATEIDIRTISPATAIQPTTPLHLQARRDKDRQETVNFKSVVFDGFHAAADTIMAYLRRGD
jgi:hypothetical protein